MKSEIESVTAQLKTRTVPGDFKLKKTIECNNVRVLLDVDFTRWIGIDISACHPDGLWLGYSVDTDNYAIAKTEKDIEISNEILGEVIDLLTKLLENKIVFGIYRSFPALYIPLKREIVVYKKRLLLTVEEVDSKKMNNFRLIAPLEITD